jgi:hypothetical protein
MALARRRSGSRALTLLGAAALLFEARSARAEPPPTVRLSLVRADGAEACAGVNELEAAVSRRLRRNPFSNERVRDIEVVVSREQRRWVARLFLRQPKGDLVGTRVLESDEESCDPLLASTALAIALSIDPDAALGPVDAPVKAPPKPAPPPAPPPSPPPPPAAPSGARHDAEITARFVMGVGLLPKVAPGFGLAASGRVVTRVRWAIGTYLLPEQQTSDRTFGFGLGALFVSGCASPVLATHFDLGLCLGLHAGVIHAVVYELLPTAPGDRAWVAGAGTLSVRVPLGSWVLQATADVVLPATRYRFRIETRPANDWVFRQELPSGLFSVGFGRRFL